MSAKYTIRRQDADYWLVSNPSGIDIAQTRTWRVARKIADLYNADVERRNRAIRAFDHGLPASALARGAVSLQEEA